MTWILGNLQLIGELTMVHLATAVPPIILSFLLSIPIGYVANADDCDDTSALLSQIGRASCRERV